MARNMFIELKAPSLTPHIIQTSQTSVSHTFQSRLPDSCPSWPNPNGPTHTPGWHQAGCIVLKLGLAHSAVCLPVTIPTPTSPRPLCHTPFMTSQPLTMKYYATYGSLLRVNGMVEGGQQLALRQLTNGVLEEDPDTEGIFPSLPETPVSRILKWPSCNS